MVIGGVEQVWGALTEPDFCQVAAEIAQSLKGGEVIFLQGQLGAGKTTFVRAFLKALGHTGLVRSPTYTWVESYQLAGYLIYHFDFYRLERPEFVLGLGLDDYQEDKQAIWLVEWPEKAQGFLPQPSLTLNIDVVDAERRCVRVSKPQE